MLEKIPPREREIVDLLYRAGECTVAELRAQLPDALSGSALRTMLARLESKGLVTRRRTETGWLYAPAVPQEQAKESMLKHLVRTFFNDSPASAARVLLGRSRPLDAEELDALERLIADARRRSKP